MKFEFMTVDRIIFEVGAIKKIGSLTSSFGNKVLLATGMPEAETSKIVGYLNKAGITVIAIRVQGEPSVEGLKEALNLARSQACNVAIGFGGGSAIDTAKVIAAMLNNTGEIVDYLEVIGGGQKLTQPSRPCIAIPTTSGTGAEVTKNAVISSKQHKIKVSLRSPYMLPELVILDPELTISVPPSVTASTGLDALTQVLEPFVSNQANPITDAFCREGLARAAKSLRQTFDQGTDLEARQDMAITSLFGGLALANAKLGVVHGFAGVIGGMFPIPHGIVCAALLPYAIEINIKALRREDPESVTTKRFNEVAQILTGNQQATAEDGVLWIQNLCLHFNIPRLSAFSIKPSDFQEIIEKSMVASSMKGNPIKLSYEELEEILKRAL